MTNAVSQISALPEIRAELLAIQRKFIAGAERGIVVEGRDIGTVVLPDAELKLFMTASPEVRAKRRYTEMLESGANVSYEEVSDNINMRDHIDSHRSADPLRRAEDAIIIDNSDLTMEEQFLFAMNQVMRVLENKEQENAVSKD